MRRVTGAAGVIAVEEHGSGPTPIVLLHGLAGDASFWSTTIRALGRSHRVIVPELRGHGRSAPSVDGDYSIEECSSDLQAVVAAFGGERVVLVGHSFGASVVLDMAARRPELVAGLLLFEAAGDFSYVPPEALRGFLAGLGYDGHYAETIEGAFEVALDGATEETERRVRAAILAAPRPVVRAVYDSLLRYRPTRALDRYDGPVRLVTAPSNAADFALHNLRPDVPREAVPDVSHWLMMDKPQVAARIISAFVGPLAG